MAAACASPDEDWQSWAAKDAPGWDPVNADASDLCTALERSYGARAEFRYQIAGAGDLRGENNRDITQALSRLHDARLDALHAVAKTPFVRAKSVWSLTEVEAALLGRMSESARLAGHDLVQFENDRQDTDDFARSRCGVTSELIEVASAADFLAALAQNQPETVAFPSNR